MSFIFGRSKKNPPNALPAATRDITSAHGPETRLSSALSTNGPQQATATKPPVGQQNAGANGPTKPLSQGVSSPEPGIMRPRAESDANATRNPPIRPVNPNSAAESPYPWSQRRIEFSGGVSPFPRYGAAINSTASKEGWIYLMGGLINSTQVKGDLWVIEAATGRMSCMPIAADNGPSPRVGHASLLVGNAFIVFGGDTKMDDGDVLDDTLYLLNTSTKQWSRASPAGPRPAGRYGHTLNILGSKIYIFGGQVEGYFFNDLVAFDLNTLQSPGNRWEVMIPNNGGETQIVVPPARTNHSVVTWQDKLFLFGGTDGQRWFNDVWTYDPRTNTWSELDCIGYIPAPREGHAAALVNDTMYIFGGRIQDGTDLGDLAAFRISTRRWYMFQNMGSSPSPRSGHSMTAYGKQVVVLGGEPSSAPRDIHELSWSYVLDTSKIRYPPTETNAQNQQQQPALTRKTSNEQTNGLPMARGSNVPFSAIQEKQELSQSPPNAQPMSAPRPARGASVASPQPGPQQQRMVNPVMNSAAGQKGAHQAGKLSLDAVRPTAADLDEAVTDASRAQPAGVPTAINSTTTPSNPAGEITRTASLGGHSRSGSRSLRQQESIDSTNVPTPRMSVDERKQEVIRHGPVDSGVGSSPALHHHSEELMKELDAARQRNIWYAAELAMARKSGYQPHTSGSPLLDQQASEAFADDDKPLIEALLRMRAELARVSTSMDQQAHNFAGKVAEIEKQRDIAISEAAYAKAKLAAHGGGSQAGTPQPDSTRSPGSPDIERIDEANRRLAGALKQQNTLNAKVDNLMIELEAERRARSLAEGTADAAQKRMAELDSYRQRNAFEVESLRAQLHEAEKMYREEADNHVQIQTSQRLMEVDKNDLAERHDKLATDYQSHLAILETLREAVSASSEKASLLEQKLSEERQLRSSTEQQLTELRTQHDQKANELESTSRQLRDAEELAEKHAAEARTHRNAVMLGLSNLSTSRSATSASVHEERSTVLQEQLDAANALARKNKDAADTAADKLRSAEERIAGLEAYQEQASRDSLTVRKQLQAAMREVQATQAEKHELQSHMERHALEGNALQVQLSTLKNLLDERGISTTADARRSRALESPSGSISRYGTPEMGRVRDLERQLDESLKAHDELRSGYEQREQEVSREWEQKLADLDSDHQGAMKYVRGLEKMLAKMKQELQRVKGNNAELEKQLVEKSEANTAKELSPPPEWQLERANLQREISDMQSHVQSSINNLEGQIMVLKGSLAETESQRDQLLRSDREHQAAVAAATERSRNDLDALRRENSSLERRARDAENKVQLFLDQFESSVDNYRRQSRAAGSAEAINGVGSHGQGVSTIASGGHTAAARSQPNNINGLSIPTQIGNALGHRRQQSSIAGESIYSTTETDLDIDDLALPDDSLLTSSEDEHTDTGSGRATPSAHSFPTAGIAGVINNNNSNNPNARRQQSASASANGGQLPNGAVRTIVHHERDRSSMALDGLASELEALRSQWENTNKTYRLGGGDKYDYDRAGGVSSGGAVGSSGPPSAVIPPLALGKGFGSSAGTGLGLGFEGEGSSSSRVIGGGGLGGNHAGSSASTTSSPALNGQSPLIGTTPGAAMKAALVAQSKAAEH